MAVMAALSGCAAGDTTGGGDPAPVPTGTATRTDPTGGTAGTEGTGGTEGTASPSVRTVEITVEGTRVDPPPGQVDLATGETLRVVVTTDAGEAVHAHGFDDLEVPVTPGEPTQADLVGDEPGVYEVELHDPDLLLLQVAVR